MAEPWARADGRGEDRLVIDAKYKLPAEGRPPAEDFQQLVTYLACLGTRRGALVLPALGAVPEETTLSLRTFGCPSEVRILKVALGGRAARVGAALESTAERLVSWAHASAMSRCRHEPLEQTPGALPPGRSDFDLGSEPSGKRRRG